MVKKAIKLCPACDGKMEISLLTCNKCGLEIKKNFEQTVFNNLDEDQIEFLLKFIEQEGNIKAMQELYNLSYPLVKNKLSDLKQALEINEYQNVEEWNVNEMSTKASDIIKTAFKNANGIIKVTTAQGKVFEINGDNTTLGSYQALRETRYEYRVFDIVTDLLIQNGGSAKKGNARNYRVGEKGCELNTVAGAIGNKYHNKNIGEYSFDPVFIIVAIMDWAGIVYNKRGYIELTEKYKELIRNNH